MKELINFLLMLIEAFLLFIYFVYVEIDSFVRKKR